MAILPYDHTQIVEPPLLTPGKKPIGRVKLNNNHLAKGLIAAWLYQPRFGLVDIAKKVPLTLSSASWEGDGIRFTGVSTQRTYTEPLNRLKIIGDLSYYTKIRFSSSDSNQLIVAIEGGAGESSADNSTLFLYSPSTGFIRYIHEYGSGSNQSSAFVAFASEIDYDLLVVRDVTAKTVKIYLNWDLKTTYNYINQPTNTGSTMYLTNGKRSTSSSYNLRARQSLQVLWDRVVDPIKLRNDIYQFVDPIG